MNEIQSARHPWVRRFWLIALIGILIALAPLVPAFFGLMLDSPYLQTYHWLLYFSVPIGLPVTIIASLAALVVIIKNRKS
jgi:hypothetical protein